MRSFELFICEHSAPVVYRTHSGWCRQEKSKVARELQHKVFCLVWSVLKEVLVKKAENDSPCCFSWLGMSICYLTSVSVTLICTFTTVFIYYSKYGEWQLSCIIFFSVLSTWCRVSFMRKCCRGTRSTLRTEVSSQKWRKPCIRAFKRTQQNISQRWSHVRL